MLYFCNMTMKIYTKTGDQGTTSLLGGAKVPKSDLRIETYGTIDELNSWIGLVNDHIPENAVHEHLREIQDRLFTIGSLLATDPDKGARMQLPELHESDIQFLEQQIDKMTDALPPMKSFILPGGHPTVSFIHVGRCVCRRAERLAVNMQQQQQAVDPIIIRYLNRLSDYLFTLARYMGMLLKAPEIPWKPR